MAVTDYDTKAAIVVRDDLAVWQRLNVTAFLISGIVGAAEPEAIGEDYLDADENRYLPLLVQPVLVFEAGAAKLRRCASAPRGARCRSPSTRPTCSPPAPTRTTAPPWPRWPPRTWTWWASPCARGHRDADAVLRGLDRHP